MGKLVEGEPREPGQKRPSWSVLAGEFDPQNPAVNSALVARVADSFWYANPISDGRRMLQSTELVLRSYELCGLQRSSAQDKVIETVKLLKEYPAQVEIFKLTPELGDAKRDKDEIDETVFAAEPSPSPVLDALRALIKKSNETEMIVFDDRQIFDRERWEVLDRTERLAEAVVRCLYREELPAEPSEL